jgi:hypothetical protein
VKSTELDYQEHRDSARSRSARDHALGSRISDREVEHNEMRNLDLGGTVEVAEATVRIYSIWVRAVFDYLQQRAAIAVCLLFPWDGRGEFMFTL